MGQKMFKYKARLSYETNYKLEVDEKQLETIITALHRQHDYAAEKCERQWKGNTDGSAGACYHYEALPCKKMAQEFQTMINDEKNRFYSDPANIREDYIGE